MVESKDIDIYRDILEQVRNRFHLDFLKETGHSISELKSIRNTYEEGMKKGEVKFKLNKKGVGGGILKFNYIVPETKEKISIPLKVEDQGLVDFFVGLQAEVGSKKK